MRRIWMLLPVIALSGCLFEDKSDDDDDDDDDDGDDSGYYYDDTGWGSDGDTDTDADTDTDTDWGTDTDTDTDWDTDTDVDPGGLSPDAVYFQYEFTLNGGDIVPYVYDGDENAGFAYIWFVESSNWQGTDDITNGCVVALELSEGLGMPSDALSSYWFGWEPDSSAAIMATSDSCENTDLRADPADIVASYTWGFGAGSLSADLESALSDAYGADWLDYDQSAFGGYVAIDGEVSEFSYGVAFETTSSNELVLDGDQLTFWDVTEASAQADGYYRAFPAYGLDATAL